MKLPNRPKITDADVDDIVQKFLPSDGGVPKVLLIGIRGYFLNTVGKKGVNDLNVYDDAMLVYEEGQLIKTFNANTDPSKGNAKLAMLTTGYYLFYRGKHKNRIRAFRAYPEGVKWDCKRQGADGVWYLAKCSHINIHDGGLTTWSEGCQTLPNVPGVKQFDEFRDLVYGLMDTHDMETIGYLLLEEEQIRDLLG